MRTAAAISITLFAALLLAISAALIVWHLKSWRVAQLLPAESPERAFAWRQFRRRMQTSGIIALLALAIFAGQFVRSVTWLGPYWLGVLLLVLWVVLLALVDIFAIHKHFSPIRAEHRSQLAALEARMRQFEAPSGSAPPTANQG